MSDASEEKLIEGLSRLVAGVRGLRLLVLFGSRARGDARGNSDWDFGYLASDALDPDILLASLAIHLGSDRIDLVDLARAGAQLRHRVAAQGRIVHAADEEVFSRFWLDAVSFWCDIEPILRAGYAAILAEVDR